MWEKEILFKVASVTRRMTALISSVNVKYKQGGLDRQPFEDTTLLMHMALTQYLGIPIEIFRGSSMCKV